jgi:hypothetical protein
MSFQKLHDGVDEICHDKSDDNRLENPCQPPAQRSNPVIAVYQEEKQGTAAECHKGYDPYDNISAPFPVRSSIF